MASATRKSPSQLDHEIAEALRGPRGNAHSTVVLRGNYPFDLIPGDIVVRRDIKGRKKYRVSHLGQSGDFVQVYTHAVGGGSGIVTFDRSQVRLFS